MWRRATRRHAMPPSDFLVNASVCDALTACRKLRIEERRALACTCKTWEAEMRTHFARPYLDVGMIDCTEDNADFVLNQLIETNRNVVLRDLSQPQAIPAQTLLKPYQLIHYNFDGSWNSLHDWRTIPIPEVLGFVYAFWLGRILAHAMLLHKGYHLEFVFKGKSSRMVNTDRLHHNRYEVSAALSKELTSFRWLVLGGFYRHVAFNDLERYSNQGRDVSFQNMKLDCYGTHVLVRHMRKRKIQVRSLNLSATVTNFSQGMYLPLVMGELDTSQLLILDLGNNNLRLAAKTLAKAFKRSTFAPKLCTLRLRDVHFHDEEVGVVCDALGPRRPIEHLDLAENPFGDAGLLAFMRTGWQLIHLKHFDLLNAQVTAAMWMRFASWIVERSEWPAIREVTIHMGNIPNLHADEQYKAAVELVKQAVIVRQATAAWNDARQSASRKVFFAQ